MTDPETSLKIKGLTRLNVAALTETLDPADAVTLTATTATFNMPPADAVQLMNALMVRVIEKHGSRGHPYQSLHAVLRKAQREAFGS
jgi:pyruvate kinase